MRSKVLTGLLQPGQCCQSFEPPLPRVRAASVLPPAAFCNSWLSFLQLDTCGLSVSRGSPCVRFKVPTGLLQPGQCRQSLEPPLLRFCVASALLPASCNTLLSLLQFAMCGSSVSHRSPCVRFKVLPGLLQPDQCCQPFEFPLFRFRAAPALPPAASCDSSIPPLQLATCGLSVSRRSPCVRFKVPTGLPQPGQFCNPVCALPSFFQSVTFGCINNLLTGHLLLLAPRHLFRALRVVGWNRGLKRSFDHSCCCIFCRLFGFSFSSPP